MWGQSVASGDKINELNRVRNDGWTNNSISSKRIGKITEKIYYYPNSVSDSDINAGNVDPKTEMVLLDPSQYSVYKRDGDFCFIINCNRNKVITDEFGNEVPIPDTSVNGVFTKFRGFITLEITPEDIPMNFSGNLGNETTVVPVRYKLKFPQFASRNDGFCSNQTTYESRNQNWRKQHIIFESGKYYSIAKFNGTVYCAENGNNDNPYEDPQMEYSNGFWQQDVINSPFGRTHFWDSGIILTNNMGTDYTENDEYEFPSNTSVQSNYKAFGAQWMNLCIYLPQIGYCNKGYSQIKYVRGTSNFQPQGKQSSDTATGNRFYFIDNTQPIAAGQFNTKMYARSDLHWTDIIEVPVGDIIAMNNVSTKGFKDNNLGSYTLTGAYRNGSRVPTGWIGACPMNGGRTGGNSSNGVDPRTYFYKGLGTANCIEYLFNLGVIKA
jgi:hypothetical protein